MAQGGQDLRSGAGSSPRSNGIRASFIRASASSDWLPKLPHQADDFHSGVAGGRAVTVMGLGSYGPSFSLAQGGSSWLKTARTLCGLRLCVPLACRRFAGGAFA
jgi:hypothetical protein